MEQKEQKEDSLYKYYSCNPYNLDALANGYLWFSNPKNLNDPFDCNFEGYRNSIAFSKFNPEYHQKMYDSFDRIGICSFTQESINQHFWSLYSANYSGFCLVFDKDKLERKLSSLGVIIDNVDYQNLPLNLDEEVKDKIKDKSQNGDENSHIREAPLRQIAFRKNKDVWGYEKEIRAFLGCICIDNMSSGKNNVEKVQNGYKVPIKESKLLKEIILGNNISVENKALILNLVQHNYPEIKILQIKLDFDNWRLKVVDLINRETT